MKHLPFDLVDLSAGVVETLDDTYKLLSEKFDIGTAPEIDLDLKNFDLLNTTDKVSIGGLLSLNGTGSFYLAFIKTKYSYYSIKSTTRTDYHNYQVWAVINSNKDFGRSFIRHESFADRLVGLMHPCELNFKDDKTFDHKFYVVCNDEQKALTAMNWNFRNAVMDMPDDIMLETAAKQIVIGNNMNLDPHKTLQLTEFASKIAALR